MSVKARVQLVVDVKVDSTWGDECTVGQVKKQAIHSARQKIGKLMQGSNDISLVNAPECLEIVYTELGK